MRPLQAALTIAVLALAGLVDAAVLTWDHQAFLLDPLGAAGACGPGGGCEISRTSAWSRVPLPWGPDLPIAIVGLGCYVALLVLAWLRWRRPDETDGRRVLLAVALASVLYSIALAAYSLKVQEELCPLCSVLYVVNLLVLGVAWIDRPPEALELAGLGRSLRGRTAALAAIAFAVSVAGVWTVYAIPVRGAEGPRLARAIEDARALPSQPAVALDTTGRPSVGPDDAPIHIVEFGDLQCPHCGSLYTALHELMEQRPGAVRVTMMHFPLDVACNPILKQPFHRRACAMAVAAECAHRQGRFDEMARWLYAERAPGDDAIQGQAAAMGLDVAAFGACLADDAATAAVRTDIERGQAAGVQATPTFYVNGRMVRGGRPLMLLEVMADAFAADADRAGGD